MSERNKQTIKFEGVFKNARAESPVIPEKKYSVPVYFMANDMLFYGHYRGNKLYQADLFYAIACDPCLMKEKWVCTHWCYVHELVFEKPSCYYVAE
jgi:hypothetical protein